MNVEFVPYQEALELHNLGALFPNSGFPHSAIYRNGNLSFANDAAIEMFIKDFKDEVVITPLYQQVFRWFRDKYNLHSHVSLGVSDEQDRSGSEYDEYTFVIEGINGIDYDNYGNEFFTNNYEEAELACLRKLIEIIKSQKE